MLVTGRSATQGNATDHRFRRRSRLADKHSYGRVFRNARRSRDQLFTVLYRSNNAADARLGLAIAKKHCKLATGRNRLKRIVRESFRQHRHDLAGLDLVVLNQPGATSASNEALFASLAAHWKRCAPAGGNKAT